MSEKGYKMIKNKISTLDQLFVDMLMALDEIVSEKNEIIAEKLRTWIDNDERYGIIRKEVKSIIRSSDGFSYKIDEIIRKLSKDINQEYEPFIVRLNDIRTKQLESILNDEGKGK